MHTLMMMLKLLSCLQQPLVYLLLALYCYNQIYLFWKQAEELGIERKAIINNSNKPFWLSELPIISLHCAPVQITFLQNVPLCDNGATAPSFLAVDSASSLICFSSFMAINIFNTFCTLKFPINKGLVLIISLSMLLIKRYKWLEKKTCHLCVTFLRWAALNWLHDMHCSCEVQN